MPTITSNTQLFSLLEELFSRKDLLSCLDEICLTHCGKPIISPNLTEVPLRVYQTLTYIVSQEIDQLECGFWKEPELLDDALELMEILEGYLANNPTTAPKPDIPLTFKQEDLRASNFKAFG